MRVVKSGIDCKVKQFCLEIGFHFGVLIVYVLNFAPVLYAVFCFFFKVYTSGEKVEIHHSQINHLRFNVKK